MTKKELSQLYYLNREIDFDQARLAEFKAYANNTAVRITGLPHVTNKSDKTALAAEITDIKNSIEARRSLSVIEYNRLNRYIASIDDPLVRQIITLRFINGLSWQQIEFTIGGNNKAESLRKKLNRYLSKT